MEENIQVVRLELVPKLRSQKSAEEIKIQTLYNLNFLFFISLFDSTTQTTN